mmetsp:Transcript_106246/g.300459  ORF Transcript_106246/g.300459 Transcript_106246/m.300459 type:complete len:233 (-) Transcript_106246:38-736(-)
MACGRRPHYCARALRCGRLLAPPGSGAAGSLNRGRRPARPWGLGLDCGTRLCPHPRGSTVGVWGWVMSPSGAQFGLAEPTNLRRGLTLGPDRSWRCRAHLESRALDPDCACWPLLARCSGGPPATGRPPSARGLRAFDALAVPEASRIWPRPRGRHLLRSEAVGGRVAGGVWAVLWACQGPGRAHGRRQRRGRRPHHGDGHGHGARPGALCGGRDLGGTWGRPHQAPGLQLR